MRLPATRHEWDVDEKKNKKERICLVTAETEDIAVKVGYSVI